jgi:hypothetical protein
MSIQSATGLPVLVNTVGEYVTVDPAQVLATREVILIDRVLNAEFVGTEIKLRSGELVHVLHSHRSTQAMLGRERI